MSDVRDNLLRDLLDKIAAEQKYDNPTIETTAVSTTGANFTSQLFHATIKSTDKDDMNVFAKAAVFGETMREQADTKDFFGLEPYFYTRMGKTYKEIEQKNDIAEEHRLVIPKFYGYNDVYLNEVLVLQDLSKDGFVTWDRMKSIDWEYASKAIEEMAKFHALSIAYQNEYPEDYADSKNVFKNRMIKENSVLMDMFKTSIDAVIQMIREENRPKVQNFIYEILAQKNLNKFYLPKRRPVMVHGDYRQSNLMHKFDQNGKLQVAIVDFQTMYPGNVTNDLLYFIFLSSDGAFRAQYYDQLIEHYYENLAAALRRLKLNPVEHFSRTDFDEEIKEMFPFGLLISCILLPIITVDLAEVTQAAEDNEFQYDSVDTIANFMSNTNDVCVQRLNDVVDDYVKWGVI